MSTDAMAVVLGVAVGVAASVPTSILLLALLRRAQRETGGRSSSAELPMPMLPSQPNIIVLNPADLAGQRGTQQAFYPLPEIGTLQDAGLRRLRVVGDEDDWS